MKAGKGEREQVRKGEREQVRKGEREQVKKGEAERRWRHFTRWPLRAKDPGCSPC